MTNLRKQRPFDPAPKPGLKFENFTKICENGFGDGHNSYAHSMAWFKEHLYVGVTRSVLCALRLQKFTENWKLDPWPVEAPEDVDGLYRQVDRRAQIWRYNPLDKNWRQVMRAPLVMGSEGEMVPRNVGYRAMTVFQGESDHEPALYVATTSPGRGPGALILRSEDGENFYPVSEYGIIGLPVVSIRVLVPFQGKLFTSPTGSRGGKPNQTGVPVVYESRDPAKGQWQAASLPGFGDPGNEAVFTLCPFRDQLYAATFNCAGFQIWRSDCLGDPPYRWTKILEQGAYRGSLNQVGASMVVFNDALYVSTGIQNGGHDLDNHIGPAASELIRIHPDDSWDLIVGTPRDTPDGRKEPLSGLPSGFGNLFNGYFWCMAVHDGWLYLGTLNWGTIVIWCALEKKQERSRRFVEHVGVDNIVKNQCGFELWRSRDGENWLPVERHGFSNPYNLGIRNMISNDYGLWIGTANFFGPRVAVKQDQGWIYADNPKGGVEVWLGST